MINKWINFFKNGIWYIQLSEVSPTKRFFIKLLRISILVSEGFTKSQIQQGATALTYYSLLAIVPIIALMLAMARAFSFQGTFEQWLIQQMPNQKELIEKIIEFASRSLQTASKGLITGIGVVLLLWSIFKILMYIETAMNQVWDVVQGRTFAKKFSDYLAVLFLLPILFFVAYGINIYISTGLKDLRSELFGDLTFIITFLLRLIPIIITGLLLTFLYIFIPNTHIRFLPAFIAAIITSTLYQVIQWAYVYFQIGVSSQNAIYGAFAALPLFLIWLHLSWVIVLLGAKLAFAIQNMNAYAYIIENVALHHRMRQVISLYISQFCIKNFCDGKPSPTCIEISNTLSIPLSLASQLLTQLVDAGVLSIVKRSDQEEGFQPARDVDTLTIKAILDMIDTRGEMVPLPSVPALDAIIRSLQSFDNLIIQSESNIPLKKI